MGFIPTIVETYLCHFGIFLVITSTLLGISYALMTDKTPNRSFIALCKGEVYYFWTEKKFHILFLMSKS